MQVKDLKEWKGIHFSDRTILECDMIFLDKQQREALGELEVEPIPKRRLHFKVGEKFKVTRYVDRRENGRLTWEKETVEFEIIKATNSTITLKVAGSDEKPITRRPKINYNGKWQFSIDDSYQNTFVKTDENV